MISRNRLKWVKAGAVEYDGKLYCSVIPVRGTSLYQVMWPDGISSKDKYNYTRAQDHAFTESLKLINNTTEDTELNM